MTNIPSPVSSVSPKLHYYSAIDRSPVSVSKKSQLLCIYVDVGQMEETSCRRQDTRDRARVQRKQKLKTGSRDFPGGPVAKAPHSQCRGLSSVRGQGTVTRSHVPQLRVCMPQLKIPHAATKTQIKK